MNAINLIIQSGIAKKALALALDAKRALDRARDDDPTLKPIRGFLVWKSYWRGKDPFAPLRCADCTRVSPDPLIAVANSLRVCPACFARRQYPSPLQPSSLQPSSLHPNPSSP